MRLPVGATIRNWGADRGYTGNSFRVDDVGAGYITVSADGTSAPRRISRGEFEKVFSIWPAYIAGVVRRGDLTTMSHNSTYILSLFKWRETN